MLTLWHDVRFGARMLLKNPGFSAVVILALSLGLGVNTAVFGLVNVLLLRPLPVAHPERLAWVSIGPAAQPKARDGLSYPEYERIRRETEVFSGVLAMTVDAWVLNEGHATRGESADITFGEYLSGNAFEVLGVRAALGRTFTPEDDRPGAPGVIVLDDALWRRQFRADPGIVGRRVYLNVAPVTVIGVMPPDWKGVAPRPLMGVARHYWVPMAQRVPLSGAETGWTADRGDRILRVMGRLQPGVSVAAAGARLEAVGQTLTRDFPASNAGMRLHVAGEIEGRYGGEYPSVRLSCTLALLVAGLVLVICCANVANLLLARATRRSRELGIRVALGAGTGRIVRQLLTESLLLAVLGGALGLAVATWFGDLLLGLLPPLPYLAKLSFEPDPFTLLGALALTVLAGVAFGLLPAWRASRGGLMGMVKTDMRTQGHRLRRPGLRQVLVITQLAISIVVVVSSGLFLRSLRTQQATDPGFRAENLVSALINPGMFVEDEAKIRGFFQELTHRLEALPGASAVSSSLYMPLINVQSRCGPIIRDGDPTPPPNQQRPVWYSVVAAHYFQTMETPLLFGRDFTEGDRQTGGAAIIVNSHLARALFGREDAAIGKRVRIGTVSAAPLEIVGVARDGRYFSLLEDPLPWIYFPVIRPELHEVNWSMRTFLVRARSARDVPAVVAGLRREVAALDPRIPLSEPFASQGHLDFSLLLPRIAVGLSLLLALLALALATMGIYSVMTYTVSQRTREIGIRIALGGRVRDIVALVLAQGLGLSLVGVALGVLGAWGLTRLLGSLLYGVSASDPATFGLTVVLVALVALLATLLPARRAARVDPMVALRQD